jgi:hypothetical protein
MMYCLRLFLPLLLLPLPLSLSPIHLTTLLLLTYALNRPCIYCSFLLVILFGSSCAWQKCFWSVSPSLCDDGSATGWNGTNSSLTGNATWNGTGLSAGEAGSGMGEMDWILYFIPRIYTTAVEAVDNTTLAANVLLSTLPNLTPSQQAFAALQNKIPWSSLGQGVGATWLRNLVGRSEWTLPCVGVKVVL